MELAKFHTLVAAKGVCMLFTPVAVVVVVRYRTVVAVIRVVVFVVKLLIT